MIEKKTIELAEGYSLIIFRIYWIRGDAGRDSYIIFIIYDKFQSFYINCEYVGH
jgi:hypothetical protein